MKRIALLIVCAFALAQIPAVGQNDPGYVPGPWHYKSIACVDTTVLSVQPRLEGGGQTTFSTQDFVQSGVVVVFATKLGVDPVYPKEAANVTHYQDTPGNTIMMNEHPGDRVQVCFLGPPAPTTYCNPDTDARGRLYRIYDYRQKAQYWGQNSEHDCGGA